MDDGTVETIEIDVVNSDYAVVEGVDFVVVEGDTDDIHAAAENDTGDILRRVNVNAFKGTCQCK